MPLLDSVRHEFTDRNALLYLLLGMISAARKMDRALAGVAPSAAAARERSPDVARPEEPAAEPTAPPADRIQTGIGEQQAGQHEPLVLLALGLVSFRNSLMRAIDPVAAAHAASAPAPQDPATERASAALGDLLR